MSGQEWLKWHNPLNEWCSRQPLNLVLAGLIRWSMISLSDNNAVVIHPCCYINNLLMNNLDQRLHRQPLVEREHTFLATYSNSIKLLFFDATLFIQNPDTWLETTQPKRNNKQRNKLWYTYIDHRGWKGKQHTWLWTVQSTFIGTLNFWILFCER